MTANAQKTKEVVSTHHASATTLHLEGDLLHWNMGGHGYVSVCRLFVGPEDKTVETRMHTRLTTRARTELPNGEAIVWRKSATVQSVSRMVMELARTNIPFLVTRETRSASQVAITCGFKRSLFCCSRDVVAVSV